MKYIKLFENFTSDDRDDVIEHIISAFAKSFEEEPIEVKEVPFNKKFKDTSMFQLFQLSEEPSEDMINNLKVRLEYEGYQFLLDDLKLIITEKPLKEACIDWLNANYSGMEVVQSKSFPNTVLYRYEPKDNVLLYDKTNNKVYVNYPKIWAFFEHYFEDEMKYYFEMGEQDIQELTQQWISETYNLNVPTTRFGNYYGRFEKCE